MNQNFKEIVDRHCNALMSKGGVLGVGVGAKGLVCVVEHKVPESALKAVDILPAEIEGVHVEVRDAGGRFDAQAIGGDSIGHFRITAGTLGCLVRKRSDLEGSYVLSNNHVLANSNDAEIGDDIFQPGPVDGGGPPAFAFLSQFVPINFLNEDPPSDCRFATAVIKVLNWGCGLIDSKTRYKIIRPRVGNNEVDAAIALVRDSEAVESGIGELGGIVGTAELEPGDIVAKKGRTTGVTNGNVVSVGTVVDVNYGSGRLARFEDQILVAGEGGSFSAGGDSGSVIVNTTLKAGGLLFAGSPNMTIANPIQTVLDLLNIDVVTS